MSKPIHTPGPLEFLERDGTEDIWNRGEPLTIADVEGNNDVANVFSADDSSVSISRERAIGVATCNHKWPCPQ
jgi:hypothetical protein